MKTTEQFDLIPNHPAETETRMHEVLIGGAVVDEPAMHDVEITWVAASHPPNALQATAVRCVSVPGIKEGHDLATWNGRHWLSIFPPHADLTKHVTWWCNLPKSPEYIAAHPEEFETVEEAPAEPPKGGTPNSEPEI